MDLSVALHAVTGLRHRPHTKAAAEIGSPLAAQAVLEVQGAPAVAAMPAVPAVLLAPGAPVVVAAVLGILAAAGEEVALALQHLPVRMAASAQSSASTNFLALAAPVGLPGLRELPRVQAAAMCRSSTAEEVYQPQRASWQKGAWMHLTTQMARRDPAHEGRPSGAPDERGALPDLACFPAASSRV